MPRITNSADLIKNFMLCKSFTTLTQNNNSSLIFFYYAKLYYKLDEQNSAALEVRILVQMALRSSIFRFNLFILTYYKYLLRKIT